MTHIILLLFITAEDTNLCDVGHQETIKYCVTEGTCSTSNHKGFTCENTHFSVYFIVYNL